MRGGAREMVLDAVGGFSFRNRDVESINLQVLQWPTPHGKGSQSGDDEVLFTRLFSMLLLCEFKLSRSPNTISSGPLGSCNSSLIKTDRAKPRK